jgi:hypothetical protein
VYEDNSRIAEWRPVSTAPFRGDLELAVLDWEGAHALIFPCRRILGGWLYAETMEHIDGNPHIGDRGVKCPEPLFVSVVDRGH